jgi:hypothetical protein
VTLPDVLTAVTSFVNDWSVFILAGFIVGIGSNLLRRLIRAGR